MARKRRTPVSQPNTAHVRAGEVRDFERQLVEGYQAMAEEHSRFAEMALGVAGEVWEQKTPRP